MPNYSTSSIYKICSINTEIKDTYIGSTTNFRDRKYHHKGKCHNSNDTHYNLNVYKFIRENGGWDAWDMIEIEKYNATDKRNLETRERHWIELLKPTLNRTIPTRTDQEYRDDNKISKSVKMKLYNQKNWGILKEKARALDTCEFCDCVYQHEHSSKHKKSRKHLSNMILYNFIHL